MLRCKFLLLAALLAACKQTASPPEPPQTVAPVASAPPGKTGTASISGTLLYRGAPPPKEGPKSHSFPECARSTAGAPADPAFQMSASRGLKNVFVWIKDGLPEGSYPVPSEPVTIDQRRCEFEPRVIGVRVGQPVVFVNSDTFLHNVKHSSFNVAMPTAGFRVTRKFDKPEVMAPLTCEVHAWMRGYAGVVTHPFFAVTDAEGRFSIEKLPAGTYTLGIWHERLKPVSRPVTLTEGQSDTMAIELGR